MSYSVVSVPEMNLTLHTSVNYGRLSSAILLDTYHISCMDDGIETLGKAKVITAFDVL